MVSQSFFVAAANCGVGRGLGKGPIRVPGCDYSPLATAPALWTIPIPAIDGGGIPESTPLQCFQIFDEVSLLAVAEAKLEY